MARSMNKRTAPRYMSRNLPWIAASLVMAAIATAGAILQPPTPNPYAPPDRSSLAWLRSPIELNPHLRLPFTSAGLGAIVFSDDGRRGWVAGNDGMLLGTVDSGKTWTRVAVRRNDGTIIGMGDGDERDDPYLWSLAMSSDGNTGWAAGQRGAIFKTTDGGMTWNPRESGTQAWLRSITFPVDDDTGWVVGDDGTILKTENGGETWTPIRSSAQRDLSSVAFSANGMRGWIVEDNDTILTTVNAGVDWSAREAGTSTWLTSIIFSPGGITGWAIGGEGTVLKTMNGGNNWTPRASGTSLELISVAFTAAGDMGLAVGDGGTILKTVDGGETWAPAASGTSATLTSIELSADGRMGWVAGGDGTILETEDGGESWVPRTRGSPQFLRSVAFSADGNAGWAVGRDGTILKTEDGGTTWAPRASGTLANLWSVTFSADGRIGWATGDDGTILKSEDGGDTWSSRRSDTTQTLWEVTFSSDGSTGWAVGRQRDSQLLKTEDGGETWKSRDLGTRERFSAVAFSTDGSTGWAVGRDGTILKTMNGGESWRPRESGTESNLRSITFLADNTTGWVVGSDGTILETRNGGETWQPRTSGTEAWLNSVTFAADGRMGWAVGGPMRRALGYSTILKTRDGGENWTNRENDHREELLSVTFTEDGAKGWAVGRGAILLTVDYGDTWHRMNGESDYGRYPAPWTWCVFLLALLVLAPALRRMREQESDTPSHFSGDRPITANDTDLLQRGPVAANLTRFLMNPNTEPPMSIAITANWGEGKSSLMNLIRASVEAEGARTVWFNAWHHQEEHHLFAALLHAVRDQAVPSLLSFRGIPFRMRLFASRTYRRPIWVLAVLFFIALAMLRIDLDSFIVAIIRIPSLRISGIGEWLLDMSEYMLPFISLAIGFFIAVQSIVASLKRSGADPENLMRAASSALAVRVFGDQLGFRHRFAGAFKEVTDALGPNRLFVFIDDLDRCRPEQVVATMEAVNFLVSVGSCYVVMGIAPEQIMRCIGVSFREIAAELDDSDTDTPASGSSQRDERQKRRDYALNYMQKLINVEIPIPKLTEDCARRLVALTIDREPSAPDGPPPGPQGSLSRVSNFVVSRVSNFVRVLNDLPSNYTAVAVFLAMEVLALVAAGLFLGAQPHPAEISPILPTPDEVPDTVKDGGLFPGVHDPRTPPEEIRSYRYDFVTDGGIPWWSSFLPAALLVAVAAAAIGRHVFVRQDPRTRDSGRFIDALNIWLPFVLRTTTNSPRQAKRFINRARYITVMSRENETGVRSPTAVGQTNEASGDTPDKEDDAPKQLSESLIVALAALQSCITTVDPQNGEYHLLLALAKMLAGEGIGASGRSESEFEPLYSKVSERSSFLFDKVLFRDTVERHRNGFDDERVTESLITQFAELASSFVMR